VSLAKKKKSVNFAFEEETMILEKKVNSQHINSLKIPGKPTVSTLRKNKKPGIATTAIASKPVHSPSYNYSQFS